MKRNKLLLLILKEKKLVASGLIAGVVIFLVYLIFFYVPLFKTSTKVFIRNIPKQDIVAAFGGGSTVVSESGFSNPLFNLVQIIESESVASRVYEKTSKKFNKDYKRINAVSMSDWLITYDDIVSAQIKPSTDIIQISLKWPNKDNSQIILNEIVKQFKNVNLEIRKSVETKQSIYLNNQLLEIASQLDNIRKEIKDYKVENKAVDILNETTELTKARVELQKQAELLKSQINYYDNKLSDLSNQLNFSDVKTALRAASIGEDPYLVQLSEDLANAQQKYAQLSSKFTDNYPDVKSVKSEINELKKNIETRKKETLGNVKIDRGLYDKPSQDLVTEMARLQAERTSTRAQLASLNNGIEKLKTQESTLPSKILGLEELQKQEKALASAYENIKQKQIEAKIKESEIVDNIVILDQASPPKYVFIFLLTRFIGLVGITFLLSIATASIKEELENKWTNSREIEEVTGKKVLGTIPWIKSQELFEKDADQFIQKSDSILGVSYGEIVSNMVRSSYLKDTQAISFVSTVTSRHMSSIIPNITATLARLNKSVILISTDFEQSDKLLKNFNIKLPKNKHDMLDVIDRINIHLRISKQVDNEVLTQLLEEAFVPIIVEGNDVFHFLHINKPVNMYDYVGTRGFNTIIDFLKQYYEFIIIDTPSKPLMFPEFAAISNVSDGVIVIAAMETNRDGLITTLERFEKSDTEILGIIAREHNKELESFFSSDIKNMFF
jgi:uncharacterized protein involved in exopolysaccharide biosynthesis